MTRRSEFLIGATRSGSGKTLLTLGLLAALSRRGVEVQPFKCGPDFIDPTLHELMVERESINLDLFMMGEECCRESFNRYSADAEAVVVEGVMGLFDGGNSSSAALAELLGIPVVLVIDVRSAAESVAAVLKGFETFSPSLSICGVILNRVGSERHIQLIRDAILASCSTRILGFFPRDVHFELPSRHLGLHMGHEIDYNSERLDALVGAIEQNIDLNGLLAVSAREKSNIREVTYPKPDEPPLRLAVARDEAFCFYYHENLKILRNCGFEIVPFSPLYDNGLPENIQGIYLGGGYPELFAQNLAENRPMIAAIQQFAAAGGFVYGECGGFMYLTEQLEDTTGKLHKMAGVFPVSVKMKSRLSRLGYRRVTVKKDCSLAPAGSVLWGHEFHYSFIVSRDERLDFLYELEDGSSEGCQKANAYGSYVHLHFARSRDIIERIFSQLLESTGIKDDQTASN